MTNVSFSGTNHEENQPCHLQLKDTSVPIKINLEKDKQLIAKDKETEIFKKRQQKRIEEMEKQLKQKSTEVQGEVQEELLQDFLKNKFPQDRIIEIKKQDIDLNDFAKELYKQK